MGLSGLVGAGAQDAVAQKLLLELRKRSELAQEEQARASQALSARRLTMDEQNIAADNERQQQWLDAQAEAQRALTDQRQKSIDMEALQKRGRSDMAGVLAMPGMTPEQKRAEMAGSALRTGNDPKIIDSLIPIARLGKTQAERDADFADFTRQHDYAEQQLRSRPGKPTAASGPRPLTQTAEAQMIARMSKDWTTASKPARDLDRQIAMMDAGLNAARSGNLAQGAQAVLVTFQKVLDPPSVVRESEYMRSAAGLSLLNRVKGAYQQLSQGGAGVPVAELEKFAALAKEAARVQQGSYLPTVKHRLEQTADRYGIPHELVFDYEGSQLTEEPPSETPYQQYLKRQGGRK